MKYDEEFKKKTVAFVMNNPKCSIRKAAKKLKVSSSSLVNWVAEYKNDMVKDAVKSVNKVSTAKLKKAPTTIDSTPKRGRKSKTAKYVSSKKDPESVKRKKKVLESTLKLAQTNVENLQELSQNQESNISNVVLWENLRLKEENKRLKKIIKSLAIDD